MDKYETNANDFLKKTGVVMTIKFLKHDKYFPDDKDTRDIYEITLTRGERSWTFIFGNSVAHSGVFIVYPYEGKKLIHDKKEANKYRAKGLQVFKNKVFQEPTAYDVLSAITKYDVGSFESFCADLGYSNDSIQAHNTYEAVLKERMNVQILWSGSEIEELRKIQ